MGLYAHSNVGLLDWLGDELLKSIADDFDDVAHEEKLAIDGISFLVGSHEILNIENKRIIKTPFSFSFYCPQVPPKNIKRIHNALRSDSEFIEHFSQLQDVIGTECDFVVGPA